MLSFVFLVFHLLCGGVVICDNVRIKNVDEFVQFKNNVNNGTNYEGTTVFLESDIDFSGKTFEPIGTDDSISFRGTFDGQGHVISNLAMNSSSQFVGLFGYSTGLTIKNVILDSSCSIKSPYRGPSNVAYIGGIIGYCYALNGHWTIENSVNMGSVTFEGNTNSTLYLGGIAGNLYSSNRDSTVKNCANYGDVTHSGKSSSSYIGGIVGYSDGYKSSNRVYIHNSLNHGIITHNGKTNSLYLGGIVGYASSTTIENCVSEGKFSLLTNASSNWIGSIVGYVSNDTSINCTYFASDLSGYKKYGGETPSESNTLSYDSTTFELDGTVSIGSYSGTSFIGALNAVADYYALRDYSHWLLNKGNNAVSFTINGRANPIKMNYQVILLPSLASEGNMSFDGWYTDDGLTTPLTEFEVTSETELYGSYCSLPNFTVTLDVNGGNELHYNPNAIVCNVTYAILLTPTRTEATFLGWFTGMTGGDKVESGGEVTILSDHTLYAHWSVNNYTITFIFGNGTEPEVRVLEFNETITYPADPVWAGYSFNGWDRNIANMPANNHTITAQWTPNNYTVTFSPSGGSILESTTKAVTFESAYGDLPTPNKTGYTFIGWFDEKNESITTESIMKTPDSHTLYAHWLEITQNQVEIVFSTKDMGKEEIEKVIKKYTDADFTITVIESFDNETRVIAQFFDRKEAENFIKKVEASSEAKKLIKKVGFIIGPGSFTPAHHPMSLLWLF